MRPGRSELPTNDKRAAILDHTRQLKMARSAHAYVRGSTRQFYAWLRSASSAEVPDGPSVWICGDCHVGNLGPLVDADGEVEVQIRDVDQTVIGNPAHDLIRLALSLTMASRSSDLPGVTSVRMLEEAMAGYEEALAYGDSGVRRLPAPDAVRVAMRKAGGRRWRHLADERIEGSSPTIPLGKRFWALESDERTALQALFKEDKVHALITSMEKRDAGDKVELIDAAYWMKGCSSLGRVRYAAIVGVGEGRKRKLALIDLKAAVEAAAPAAESADMPRDNAKRVVEGARHLSPNLGDRMLAVQLNGEPVVLRELAPQDLKLEVESLTCEDAKTAARYLAAVVGLAHGRQMTLADRTAWLKALKRRRSKTLDAPSWLWTSVVELVGQHESAYLEHCRKYALAEDKAS
ncbi:DUF2252 family protein [Caulobacter sp. S45]|uniref:DUF2252 family protein n=1 Tax=Caulobacter sp. S45 TaxID=1641861 RepID=UPI001575E7AA|nr:DUF2252 family protein [Caulobacter sp. S45]